MDALIQDILMLITAGVLAMAALVVYCIITMEHK